jgi:sigma-B regulation protein RsbU (phosphoserine phosphatase)
MSDKTDRLDDLTTLVQITEILNQSVDVQAMLTSTLAKLLELMGLETGWIFLVDPGAQDARWGPGFVLAAHHNLPPALAPDSSDAWDGGCQCQGLWTAGSRREAYNEVRCSRLAAASGDRRGLAVHASAALRSGDRLLGILNVAGPDWASFSPRALALLSSVAGQMGIALERARLYDLLHERRIDEQSALLNLSNQLLSRLDLDDVIDYLVEEVPCLLQADAAALLLPADEPDMLAFYATYGWRSDPVAAGYRVSADQRSSPGLAMHTRQPVLVRDVEQDLSMVECSTWLHGEGFRGHAVVPLIAEQAAIGALMIDMREPRLLDEEEVRLLRLLANQAAIAIVKARLHQEELKQRQVEKELAVARQIQLSLLPRSSLAVPGWEFAEFYQPAQSVGGDFYDFFELPGEPGRLGLVIADVAGKGVPAALFMALSRTMIRTAGMGGRAPAATLLRANRLILNDSRAEMFLTAFYAELDTRSGRLAYARAGHDRPLWWHAATGDLDELDADGIVLGALEAIDLEECAIDLAPGDLVLAYTDGVTDAMDGTGERFGIERLRAAVAADPTGSARQVLSGVVRAVSEFTGDTPQFDDLTLVVVKRSPHSH